MPGYISLQVFSFGNREYWMEASFNIDISPTMDFMEAPTRSIDWFNIKTTSEKQVHHDIHARRKITLLKEFSRK
jgi:hypothetical protein